LIGGPGDDTIDGNRGADTAYMDAVEVEGFPAQVNVLHAEAADAVEIDGIGGKDRVKSKLPAGIVQLLVDGVPLS